MSDELTLAQRLTEAALVHVAFDGWSDETLAAAAQDLQVDLATARALFPRGGLDLALSYHQLGDAAMVETLQTTDLSDLRFRDRVVFAIRSRLETADKEAVRRASTLMALPQNAPLATRALWNTVDAIWDALGDPSEDGNWYSKRVILSGVYSATVLYWLGDESEGHADTWAFLERRIEDVMRFEQTKAQIKASPVLRNTVGLPFQLLEKLRKPAPRPPLPGNWPSGRA